MTKIEQLEQKVKRLEQKICCKTQFFDTIDDLPTEGSTGVIYVTEDTANIYIWDGTEYITSDIDALPGERPFVKTGNTSETSATNVLSTDDIFHEGKVSVGESETIMPFSEYYDLQVGGDAYTQGMQRADEYYMNKSTLTIAVDPVNGVDGLDPTLYPHPNPMTNAPFNAFFKTWTALVDFVNSVPQTDIAIVTFNATVSTPIQVDYPLAGFIGASTRYGNDKTIIGKRVWLFNKNKLNSSWLPYYPSTFMTGGAYFDIRNQLSFDNCEVTIIGGNFNFYDVISFQVGQLSVINFLNCSVYAAEFYLNLSPTQSNGAGSILLRNRSNFLWWGGGTGVNFTANDQVLFRTYNGGSQVTFRNADAISWNTNGFTGSRLHKKIQGYSNDFGDLSVTFHKGFINTQIDFTECMLNLEGRLFLGVDYWQTSHYPGGSTSYGIDNMQNLFLGGNIPFRVPRISEYDNDAAAGASGLVSGMAYKTSSTNTLGLPSGVLMVKQ